MVACWFPTPKVAGSIPAILKCRERDANRLLALKSFYANSRLDFTGHIAYQQSRFMQVKLLVAESC